MKESKNFPNRFGPERHKIKFLAPNGMPSRYEDELIQKIIKSTEFMNWFGDWISDTGEVSRARYKDTGEPILFTHRTKSAIEKLSVEHDKTFGTENGLAKKALYFTTANLFEYGPIVHRGFLNLRNPANDWDASQDNDGCLLCYDTNRQSYHAAIFKDDQFFDLKGK